jgi:hypothetical protein
VFVPSDANLLCEPGENGSIGFEIGLQSSPATACEYDSDRIPPGSSFVCTKRFLTKTANLVCSSSSIPFVEGRQSATVVIEKTGSGTRVSVQ